MAVCSFGSNKQLNYLAGCSRSSWLRTTVDKRASVLGCKWVYKKESGTVISRELRPLCFRSVQAWSWPFCGVLSLAPVSKRVRRISIRDVHTFYTSIRLLLWHTWPLPSGCRRWYQQQNKIRMQKLQCKNCNAKIDLTSLFLCTLQSQSQFEITALSQYCMTYHAEQARNVFIAMFSMYCDNCGIFSSSNYHFCFVRVWCLWLSLELHTNELLAFVILLGLECI